MLSEIFANNQTIDLIILIAILIAGVVLGRIIYGAIQLALKKILTERINEFLKYMRTPIIFLVFVTLFTYSLSIIELTERGQILFDNIIFILSTFAVLLFILKTVSLTIHIYFEKHASPKKKQINEHVKTLIRRVINLIILLIGLIYIIDNLGYNVASFVAGLGIGGLALAFAAQDTLKNFFGGVTIFLDRPFEIGDRIKLDAEKDGFVRKIGLRSTVLETFAGTQIIIPNARASDTILENISREQSRRVTTTIGLEYSTSSKKLERAKEIITKIILENKDTEDRSIVVFNEFADSALNIFVIYWIKNFDNILGAKDAINTEIKKKFDKEKISIAFPSRTVYMKKL